MMLGFVAYAREVMGEFAKVMAERNVSLKMIDRANKNPSLLNRLAEQLKSEAIDPYSCDVALAHVLPYYRFFGPTDILRHTGFSVPDKGCDFSPTDLEELAFFLHSPCPIMPEKRICDNWYLFYLPVGLTVMDLRRMFPDTRQPRFRPFRNEIEEARFENDRILNSDQSEHEWVLFYDGPDFCANKALQEQLNMSTKACNAGCHFPKPVEAVAFHFFKFLKNGVKSNQNYHGRTGAYNGRNGHIFETDFPDRIGQRYCVGNHLDDGIEIVVRDNCFRSRDLGLFLAMYPDMIRGGVKL